MVCVVKESHTVQIIRDLEESGETVWEVGRLVERTSTGGEGCVIRNCEEAWCK